MPEPNVLGNASGIFLATIMVAVNEQNQSPPTKNRRQKQTHRDFIVDDVNGADFERQQKKNRDEAPNVCVRKRRAGTLRAKRFEGCHRALDVSSAGGDDEDGDQEPTENFTITVECRTIVA